MSNRDQRTSPPEDHRDDRPEISQSGLSEELAAVLKLLATQKSLTHASGRDPEASLKQTSDEIRRLESDLSALHAMNPSAALDRLQREIDAATSRVPDDAREDLGSEWDHSSAEALTRLYENSPFGPDRKDLDFEMGEAGRGNVPFYAVKPEASIGSDRAWLEERFADIAAKLESSLAEICDNHPVQRIDGRLESMEARICEALQSLVTRSDLESFRSINPDFETIAGNIDKAAAQLSRLDTIEGNLESVLDRLSDDRLYRETSSTGHPIDFQALADATAESVLSRLSELGLGRVDAAELAEIRKSINVMIDERRRHDEQSMAILDTLQQAMISVLDRVDALSQPGMEPGDQDRADDQAFPDNRADDNPFEITLPDLPSTSYGGPLEELDSEAEEFLAKTYPEPPVPPCETEREEGLADVAATGDDALNTSAVDRIRQELIAEARRAKQQAAERPAKPSRSEAAQKSAPDVKPGASRLLAAETAAKSRPLRQPARRFATVNTGGTLLGVQRRKLLVGAVIVLFAAAGALMLLRTTSGAPEVSQTIEQPLATTPMAADRAPAHEAAGAPESSMGTSGQPAEPHSIEDPATQTHEANPEQTGQASPHLYDAPLADTARPLALNLSGVTVQESQRMLTPDQLAQLGERQAMAHLSTQLGEAAVQATPIALIPDADASVGTASIGSTHANETGSVLGSGKQLKLPPASVGPMSLRLAAAQGDKSAEFEVGARLAEGKGTQQDFKEAARWYQRSAAQGFAQAQYRLGTLYERGLGVPRDLGRANVWYQRAAENGNLKAMHNLAVLSAGQGSAEPDYETAVRWFTAAAERGLADSQYNLAVLLANGLGTPKDLKKAYMYFTLAARSGDQEARRRQEALRADLSVDDLGAAERMVEGWRRKPSDRLANDARAAGEDWKSRADNSYNG